FKEVKNIKNPNGSDNIQVFFKGNSEILSESDTRIESEYTLYSYVPNSDYARDQSWTHKLYNLKHKVVKTLDTSTNVWSRVDVGVGVGEQNQANKFICHEE
ncbi:MAG: hypothetical protein K2Q18_04730, partial [Bdellovibrionales bacterium]|nr:hypothetical protein [Bdellovibrionales bacterium]